VEDRGVVCVARRGLMWLDVAQRRSQIVRMFVLLSTGAKRGAKHVRGSRQHPATPFQSAACLAVSARCWQRALPSMNVDRISRLIHRATR
jgi:hypothetical protein